MILTPKGWKRLDLGFSDIAAAIQTDWPHDKYRAMGRGNSESERWDNNRGWEKSRDIFLRSGLIEQSETDAFQRDAREMLEALRQYRPLDSALEYTYAEAGDEPDVPEYLAGQDFNMVQFNATAPTRHFSIIVHGGVNSNIDAQTIRTRGLLIQSLVEYLTADQHNSVDLLWVCTSKVYNGTETELVKPDTIHVKSGDRALSVLHVNTRPLDRDLCRYMFADVAFFRRVFSDLTEQKFACGSWGMWKSIPLPNEAIPPDAIVFNEVQENGGIWNSPETALKELKRVADTQIADVMQRARVAGGGI
jgi:hypothetical protein